MSKKVKKSTDKKWVARYGRARRIRKAVSGTAERPRLCVTRSNRRMLVQLINDAEAKTLLSLSTDAGKTANVALSTELGKSIAKKAASVGISTVVFDRGGRVFHGRVAAVAAGAREGGLKF